MIKKRRRISLTLQIFQEKAKNPLHQKCHIIDESHNRHCLAQMINLNYICTVLRPLRVETIALPLF